MCKDLKSVKEVKAFYIASSLTRSYDLQTVWSLLFAFGDFDSSRKVGFDVYFHTSTLQHMDKDGEELANEAALSSQFWTRTLSAIGRLIRGHLAHGMTYPGKFAAGLSDDPDEEAWAFNEFRLDWDAWLKLQTVGGGIFWTKMVSRSSMIWTVVDETFQMLIAEHWTKTEAVKAQFSRLFSHMGSTYPVECVFQKSADHADRDNANKRLHGRALWTLPMQERFLEKIFSFPQVSMDEVIDVPNTNEECGLPVSFFEVKHKDCSIPASDIVSDKQATQWQTFGGASYWQILSDQCSLAWCARHKQMKHGADCWRSFIIPVGVILQLDNKHYVTLLQWASVVMMAEVDKVVGPGDTTVFWKFLGASKSALVIRPIYNFEFKLVPAEWLSPKMFAFWNGKELPESWADAGLARQTGPPEKFLHGAAKAAFWDVPPKSVQKLMKQQYNINLNGSDCDILAGAIYHILKCSDIDLAKYLELRCLCKHTCLSLYDGVCVHHACKCVVVVRNTGAHLDWMMRMLGLTS